MDKTNASIDYLSAFRNKRILIIGDASVDHFISGKTTRISPDAPVPLVEIKKEERFIGGIGIIAKYIHNLGGEADLVSCVGNDFEGEHFIQEISEMLIGVNGIFRINSFTPSITRVVSQDQQLLRLEKSYQISPEQLQQLNQNIDAFLVDRIIRADIVLILDYNMGLLHPILITKILAMANEQNKKILVRPDAGKEYYYQNVDLLIMNRRVACAATGVQSVNETSIRIIGTKLINEVRAKAVFVPWIEGSSFYFTNDGMKDIPSILKQRVKNFSNIGSATIAAIAMMMASGSNSEEAISIGQCAGSLAAMQARNEFFTLEQLKEAAKLGQISGK